MSPNAWLFLDEIDMFPRICYPEGSFYPGDPGPNYQAGLAYVGNPALDGGMAGDTPDSCGYQVLGLMCCPARLMLVNPGNMLADVSHLEQEGVESGLLAGRSESAFVHQRRAGGHHDPVELVFLDVLLDHRLTRIRAHISVGSRDYYIGEAASIRCDTIDINCAANICAALANVNANSWLVIVAAVAAWCDHEEALSPSGGWNAILNCGCWCGKDAVPPDPG
jgi:hypothetical protein